MVPFESSISIAVVYNGSVDQSIMASCMKCRVDL